MADNGYTLDIKIHVFGWNFLPPGRPSENDFFGAVSATKVPGRLQRISRKVKRDNFNFLEVTGIVGKRFLGVPYGIVSAHSRHIQQSCQLDTPEQRRTDQQYADWARG